jgi:hypothetical protein
MSNQVNSIEFPDDMFKQKEPDKDLDKLTTSVRDRLDGVWSEQVQSDNIVVFVIKTFKYKSIIIVGFNSRIWF